MENVIHQLTLDLTGPDMCPMIEVQRGDSARTLIISLTQGGRPYWIDEGLTAALFATKPDGNPLFNACTIEKNRVRYDFTPQTVNVAGVFDCEIWLVAGDKRELTTPKFTIAVDERMRTDDVIPESEPEYTAITEMVAAGTAMIEDLREALEGLVGVEEILTQARVAAEAASNSEAAAEGLARTAADAAADALGYAEDAEAHASAAKQSEDNSRANLQDAEVAAQNAEAQAKAAAESERNSRNNLQEAEVAAQAAQEAARSIGVGGVKVTDGEAVGVWLQAEGTEREPVLHLYGDHGDEPTVVRNVARAELDREAVPLGQVKELVAAAGGGGLTVTDDGNGNITITGGGTSSMTDDGNGNIVFL